MLVTLKLNNVVLVDVASEPVSLPSLKYLKLNSQKYPGDEFVKRFLSSCIVLEHLDVDQCPGDNVTVFTVRVPSLESLYVRKSSDTDLDNAEGFVIDAPSLKYLGITDSTGGFCVIESEMPNIVKADVDTGYYCRSNVYIYVCCTQRDSPKLQSLELEQCIPFQIDRAAAGLNLVQFQNVCYRVLKLLNG
ncbi:unnamed protein product [Microthlaspi erraticum]|uniref:F-box/LRR-repeat protein 15/At3g58940/PEG3-like LRR domain-containing protein n=1 Tax=Microthlaspi erraticum TaxID=1685480 RepID=A0A6D2IVX8_9BRAS|nr:unnamed protein product [Microthlaspi erraticum]